MLNSVGPINLPPFISSRGGQNRAICNIYWLRLWQKGRISGALTMGVDGR
jgi:hypothetical protein